MQVGKQGAHFTTFVDIGSTTTGAFKNSRPLRSSSSCLQSSGRPPSKKPDELVRTSIVAL